MTRWTEEMEREFQRKLRLFASTYCNDSTLRGKSSNLFTKITPWSMFAEKSPRFGSGLHQTRGFSHGLTQPEGVVDPWLRHRSRDIACATTLTYSPGEYRCTCYRYSIYFFGI